jgi:hypothetical protein
MPRKPGLPWCPLCWGFFWIQNCRVSSIMVSKKTMAFAKCFRAVALLHWTYRKLMFKWRLYQRWTKRWTGGVGLSSTCRWSCDMSCLFHQVHTFVLIESLLASKHAIPVIRKWLFRCVTTRIIIHFYRMNGIRDPSRSNRYVIYSLSYGHETNVLL